MKILLLASLVMMVGCVARDEISANSTPETLSAPIGTSDPTEGSSAVGSNKERNPTHLVSNSLEGAWVGEITYFQANYPPDEEFSGVMEVLLLNCDGSVEIWTRTEDSLWSKSYDGFQVISRRGNHLLSVIESGGAWVETLSWGIISIDNNRAYIQRNRLVSNPLAEEDDEDRYFGQFGFGDLERKSLGCDVWGDGATESGPE